MSGDFRRHSRHDLPVVASRSARARRTTARPVLECLEGRQLLTVFTGFSHVGRVLTPSGVYTIQVSGPGILKAHPAGNGSTDIKVLGTTVDSTLTISQTRPRFHVPNGLMSINSLTIGSGQIGSIIAKQSELDGPMTPLTTSLTDLELGAVGSAAQIDVNGNVGTMTLGSVALGPGGHIMISRDVSSAASIGSMSIDGGQFVIGNDSHGSKILGDVTLSHDGHFDINRDETGTLDVGGSVNLSTGGQIFVGRTLHALTVGGDVLFEPLASGAVAGGIVVGGDLNQMTVTGIFRGQNSATAIDLGVGSVLDSLTVSGGGVNQAGIQEAGIQDANISVGKNLNQLIVPNGTSNTTTTVNGKPYPVT